MIDAVYVLKDDTGDSNQELRYSIRSIQKHLKGIRNLVIVSNKLPPFLDPEKVVHVEETDRENTKDQSIFRKILTACNDGRVSDPFLFLNDDHFILQDAMAIESPYYHKMDTRLSRARGHTSYSRRLQMTSKVLTEAGLRDLHYDVHFPIVYRKSAFREVAEAFPWRKAAGYVVKSLYGNYHKLEGPAVSDCKIHRPISIQRFHRMIDGRFCFSTDERALDTSMRAEMDTLYGGPSRWELAATTQPTTN